MSARVYLRKFDHDEARRRHAAGEAIHSLSQEYGVTYTAVYRVVVPGVAERMERNRREWVALGRCDDCGGPMSNHTRSLGGTRCKECAHLAAAVTVRSDALRCVTCREWKPDDDFPRSRAARKTHRGRKQECRACNTVAKRDYRRRNREKTRAYDREYKRRRKLALAQPVAEDTGKPKTGAGS